MNRLKTYINTDRLIHTHTNKTRVLHYLRAVLVRGIGAVLHAVTMVFRRDALSAAAAVLGTLVPLAEVLVTSVRAVEVEVTDQRVVDSLGAVLTLEQRQAVCNTTHLWQIDTHQ